MIPAVDDLFAVLLAIEDHLRGDVGDTDDAVTLWLELAHAHGVLGDSVKAAAEEAGGRLLDRDDPRAEHVTRSGDVVHLAPGYSAERWRGHDVLAELAADVIDTSTGERLQAVPISVLVDVLPGCATPELTSSKWRTTGLGRYLSDWRRYRSRDDAPLVIRRGSPR